MAFKVWITDNNVSIRNLLSGNDFDTNAERLAGFQPNSVASAKNVNSAIRQANLIAVALMESMGIMNLDLTSSLADVKSAINSYFTNAFSAKLGTSGNGSNVSVDFTQGSTGSLTSGRSLSALFGTLSAWCASFGTLAKKSVVDSQDIKDGAVTLGKIGTNAVTTSSFALDAKAPLAKTADTATETSLSSANWINASTSSYVATIPKTADRMTIECSVVYKFTNTAGITSRLSTSFIKTIDVNRSMTEVEHLVGTFALTPIDKISDLDSIRNVLIRLTASTDIKLTFVIRDMIGGYASSSSNYIEIQSVTYRILK